MRRIILSILIACAAGITLPQPIVAQSDWGAKRDPFDAKLISRLKRNLARNPHDRASLRNITRLYRRYRSLTKLVGEYQNVLKKLGKKGKKGKSFSALVVLKSRAIRAA